MSFITSVGHFFEHLFGKSASIFEAVFSDVSKLTQAALPIVEAISGIANEVAAQDGLATTSKIAGYLGTVASDGAAVSSWVSANTGLPVMNVLHNAGVFALAHTTGSTKVALKDLDLAVQLAYNVYSKQHPETTGSKTVAAIAPVK